MRCTKYLPTAKLFPRGGNNVGLVYGGIIVDNKEVWVIVAVVRGVTVVDEVGAGVVCCGGFVGQANV